MNRTVFERYVTSFCEDLAQKNHDFSHRHRHACVITYNDAVLSSAVNVTLQNDFTRVYNDLKGLHAEALAIMRALHRHSNVLHKSELWVCRTNGTRLSRPCPMCMNIIKTFRIPVIHYTDYNGVWNIEQIDFG